MKIFFKYFLILFAAAAVALPGADLPYIVPERVVPLPIKSRFLPGGAVEVKLGKAAYVINSDFSLQPGWAKLQSERAENISSIKISGSKLLATGKEVKRPVEKIVKNNRTFYKVVLQENESCAIVKQHN